MQRILKSHSCDVWLTEIQRPYVMKSPFDGGDYALLLINNDGSIRPTERVALSEEIVRTSCRYAVCTGFYCSEWDDSIDEAYVGSDPNFDPPDERFVMTTWHENETLNDVVEYFRWNTVFDDFVPDKFLIMVIGPTQALQYELLELVEKWFCD